MKINKHTTLKLICLSVLMLNGALQAMKADVKIDPQALGEELINTLESFNETLDYDFLSKDKLLINVYTENTLELIRGGADVNAVFRNQTSFRITPLMEAAKTGSLEIVTALIAAGANVTSKDINGNTALLWAMHRGYSDVAKLLIDAMLEAPINPSNAPLTTEQEDLLRVAGLSLLRAYPSQVPKDIRRLILQDVAATFRKQNFIREQINRIKTEDKRKYLLEYLEAKIKSKKI